MPGFWPIPISWDFVRFQPRKDGKKAQPEKCRQRTKWTNGGDLYAIKIGNFRAVYPCLSDNNVAQWIGLTETVPFEIVNFVGRWSLTFYNYFIIVGLPVNPSVITLTTRWPQARWYHLHRLGRCSSRSICNGRVPAGNVLAHPHFLVSSWLELPRTGNLWKSLVPIGNLYLFWSSTRDPFMTKDSSMKLTLQGWSSDLQPSSLAVLFCVVQGPTTQSKVSVKVSTKTSLSLSFFSLSLSLSSLSLSLSLSLCFQCMKIGSQPKK